MSTNTADRFDFLDLRKDVGKARAFALYALGNLAVVLIFASVAVFVLESRPDQKSLLQQRHEWLNDRSAHRFFSDENSVFARVQNDKQDSKSTQTLDRYEQNTAFSSFFDQVLGVNTAQRVQLPDRYYQTSLAAQSSSDEHTAECYTLKVHDAFGDDESTLDKCEGDGAFLIYHTMRTSVRTHALARMGACDGAQSCQLYCQTYGGAWTGGACFGTYVTQDFCALAKENTNWEWSVADACYGERDNGTADKDSQMHAAHTLSGARRQHAPSHAQVAGHYTLRLAGDDGSRNDGHQRDAFTVTVRHAGDPMLTAVSNAYAHSAQLTPNQVMARNVYVAGIGLFVSTLVAAYAMKRRAK